MSRQLETRDGGDGSWLPLIDYSVRSGVSLSTIRRKIKNNSIQYRLENGRYLILFNEANNLAARKASGPFVTNVPPQGSSVRSVPNPAPVTALEPVEEDETESLRMISEAFEHVLKEKDERIQSLEKRNVELEHRLTELKLLVRLLEEKYEVRY